MRASAVVALAVLLLAPAASALYFQIKESETRCFIEEIPLETMVVGIYKTQVRDEGGSYTSGPGTGIHVEINDPNDELIMSKSYEAEGRFSFISHEAGEHTICLHTNSSRWFGGREVRVHLDLRVGESANDYDLIAKKEQLSQVETRLFQLLAQARQILNEQTYQRTREAVFREISESTNQRVLWWSIAQAIVLVLTGMWQVRHLRGFFEAKKLV